MLHRLALDGPGGHRHGRSDNGQSDPPGVQSRANTAKAEGAYAVRVGDVRVGSYERGQGPWESARSCPSKAGDETTLRPVAQPPTRLLVTVRVLALHGVIVRRSAMASRARRRGDLARKPSILRKKSPIRFGRLRGLLCLGLSLVSVCYSNLVSLIRISRPPAHEASRLILLAPYKILLR